MHRNNNSFLPCLFCCSFQLLQKSHMHAPTDEHSTASEEHVNRYLLRSLAFRIRHWSRCGEASVAKAGDLRLRVACCAWKICPWRCVFSRAFALRGEVLCWAEDMVELGGFGAREASPDSVIFTLESNFSLFSSASASVDRCSFASDAHDRDSLASEISLVIQSVHFVFVRALAYLQMHRALTVSAFVSNADWISSIDFCLHFVRDRCRSSAHSMFLGICLEFFLHRRRIETKKRKKKKQKKFEL